MKIITVVGARPQFIKCAPVSRKLREVAGEVLVHTGQHYDGNMSDVFFRDLDIPKPDYNLGVGSSPHGAQSGEMLKLIEEVLLKELPDYVVVFGDTNSTLAGALAAAKLHIPVAHIEAGLRSFNRQMPEEINRVIADHLSSLLFCPTETAVKNLAQEGITDGVELVGDVMYEVLLDYSQTAENRSMILTRLNLQPKGYFLATVHRPENTDDCTRFRSIIVALQELSAIHPVIWPVHPRTRKALASHNPSLQISQRLHVIDPIPYLDMLVLEKSSRVILTDSGGVQKEAYWFGVPCVTLRDETEWVETVEQGWNAVTGTDPDRIVAAVKSPAIPVSPMRCYGDARAAKRIVQILVESYESRAAIGEIAR